MAIEIRRRNGLQEFADAAIRGAQVGQQYRSNALNQQRTENDLADYTRQQNIRSGISAIAPEDYSGQAGVYQQYGENERAGELLRKAKQQKAAQGFSAARAGDWETATKVANDLFGTQHKFAGVGKDGTLAFDSPTGATAKGMTFKRAQLPERGFLQALVAAGGPELAKAYELDLKERETTNNQAYLRAMSRGGSGGDADFKLETETEKGVPVYRKGDQYFIPNAAGKLAPFSPEAEKGYGRIRYLSGKQAAPAIDPYADLRKKSLDTYQPTDPSDPGKMVKEYVGLKQNWNSRTIVDALGRGGKGTREAMEAIKMGVDPQMLIDAGFNPDTVSIGENALALRQQRGR